MHSVVKSLLFVAATFSVAIACAAQNTIDCTLEFGKKCTGCNDYAICAGDAEPVSTGSCADDAATPYCLNGVCTANPPSLDCVGVTDPPATTVAPPTTAPPPPNDCTTSGYLPHPTDCHRFRLCADTGGESVVYECPSRFVYDAAMERCRFQWWATECHQVQCDPAKPDQLVPFPGVNGMYAMCVDGWPIVFRCPDAQNFVFDADLQRCVQKCRAPGRAADPDDCRAYYECSLDWLKLVGRRWVCVQGWHYSAVQQKCVRGTCTV